MFSTNLKKMPMSQTEKVSLKGDRPVQEMTFLRKRETVKKSPCDMPVKEGRSGEKEEGEAGGRGELHVAVDK